MKKLYRGVKWECTICGKTRCDCWEVCSCGYSARKGESCRNPNTTRCSTKIKYGKKAAPPAEQGDGRDLA